MKKLLAMVSIAIAPCLAQATPVDYALLSSGATFVSASSYIFGPNLDMENNLLRDTKVAWYSNGDSSFMFGNNDSTQSVTINLGTSGNIGSVGALVDLVDRPVDPAKFQVKVSANGNTWQDWTGTATNADGLLSILGSGQNVQYIQYIFGAPSWIHYPGNGESRILQVYAVAAVPEPETYAMLLAGLGLLGLVARRRKVA